jgi:hypothetical protein
MKFLWTYILLFGAAGAVAADELLVAGRVESIVLTPAGAPGCPDLNDMRGPRLTVSNDCGCQEAKIKVEQTYVGDSPGATLSITSAIYGLARGGTRIETVSTTAQHHQD